MPDQTTPDQPVRPDPVPVSPALPGPGRPEAVARPSIRRIPRQGRLAIVLSVAAAIAVAPASQALASGFGAPDARDRPPRPVPSARPTPDAGRTPKARPTCTPSAPGIKNARFDDKTWWPFSNALHGADVMETRDGGIQSVTYQRGTVLSATAGSVTIVSKDNFSATWTLSPSTKVRVRGELCSAADLKPGQYVGAWGSGAPGTPTARFVVVKSQRRAPSPSPTPTQTPSPTPTPTPSPTPAAGQLA